MFDELQRRRDTVAGWGAVLAPSVFSPRGSSGREGLEVRRVKCGDLPPTLFSLGVASGLSLVGNTTIERNDVQHTSTSFGLLVVVPHTLEEF